GTFSGTCAYNDATQLVADSSGNLHVMLLDGYNVRYNHFNGTNWVGEEVPWTASGTPHISFDVDHTGEVHAAFHDMSVNDFQYFHGTSGDWSGMETIEDVTDWTGRAPSLKVTR